MKINDLFETPLPPDWNKDVYRIPQNDDIVKQTYFKKMVKYARERAAKIGKGSSRIAFEVEYEGRPTILKVALNNAGLAQNEFEASLTNDYYLKELAITIPIIDFDEENVKPTWVQTEKAMKCTLDQFKKAFSGFTPDDLVEFVKVMTGKRKHNVFSDYTMEEYNTIFETNEHANSFVDFIGNFDIPPDDFSVLGNWGVFHGNVVIIDLGGSRQVLATFYGRKKLI